LRGSVLTMMMISFLAKAPSQTRISAALTRPSRRYLPITIYAINGMSNLFVAALRHYIQPQRAITVTMRRVRASAIWPCAAPSRSSDSRVSSGVSANSMIKSSAMPRFMPG